MTDPETPTVERFQVAGKMDEIAIYSHDGDADWVFDFDALREFVGTESTLVREADYLTLQAERDRLREENARLTDWKASAMQSLNDWWDLGLALARFSTVRLGENVSRVLTAQIPAKIEQLEADLARLRAEKEQP